MHVRISFHLPCPPCCCHFCCDAPAVLRTGVISQASGSAYAEFRNTKVMVGVYGPRQSERKVGFSEQGRINCDVKLATFATRQRGKFGQVSADRRGLGSVALALQAGQAGCLGTAGGSTGPN
jgi:hypothetical protein